VFTLAADIMIYEWGISDLNTILIIGIKHSNYMKVEVYE